MHNPQVLPSYSPSGENYSRPKSARRFEIARSQRETKWPDTLPLLASRGNTGDVTVIGGADVTQQCLRTGRFDEFHIALVPIFLGEGRKLFENLGDDLPKVSNRC